MQPTLARLRHVFLAADHHLHLLPHLRQPPQDVLVPVYKPEDFVFDPRLLAEFPNQNL